MIWFPGASIVFVLLYTVILCQSIFKRVICAQIFTSFCPSPMRKAQHLEWLYFIYHRRTKVDFDANCCVMWEITSTRVSFQFSMKTRQSYDSECFVVDCSYRHSTVHSSMKSPVYTSYHDFYTVLSRSRFADEELSGTMTTFQFNREMRHHIVL